MLPLQRERAYRLLITVVLLATLLSALITLTMVKIFTKEATAQTTASEVTYGFRFDESENDMVTGFLAGDDLPQVTFRSEVTILDDERSTAEDTKFAVTQVRVAGLVIDAKRNLRTQVVTEGGHGLRITEQQKESMLVLCRELEGSIGAVGVPAPPEEDLLLRITCYYAEAPVGMKLTNQTIEPPPVSNTETVPEQQTDAPTGSVKFVDASLRPDWTSRISDIPSTEECVQAERLSTAGVLSEDLATRAAACRRPDDDGIRYLSCSYRTHLLWHDATTHCGRDYRIYTGVASTDCRGRCGPKCSGYSSEPFRCPRWGVYTRDCAEHDFCYEHHRNSSGSGPDDRDCGDQWLEASDDFSYGGINCNGRC